MGEIITVIGSSNTDFIMKMDRLPRKGETITNAEFLQTFGGKGANQAVGAARAGGEVYFVSCVGDDVSSMGIIQNMRGAGVHTDYVFQETGIASGSALIMIDANGDNYLSVAPGANYRLRPAHLEQAKDLLARSALIVLQYEVTPETLYTAIDLASTLGKPVLFNFAPAQPLDEQYLRKLDLLVANEVEAEFICGFPLDSEAKVQEAATALLVKGPRVVVLTLGAQGILAATGTERIAVPAYPVQVVDTTAAGDVFCGALAVGLVEGKGIAESVRFANAAAAIAVTRLGAQPSIPTRQEIDQFLRQGWPIMWS